MTVADGLARTLAAWLAVSLAACGSVPPTRYFTLPEAPAAPVAATSAASPWPAVQLLPVRVTDLLDRPQIVRRVSPTQVTLSEYALWAQPLRQQVARAVVVEGQRRWPGLLIDTAPAAPAAGTPRLTLELLRLEVDGGTAVAELAYRWTSPEASAPRVGQVTGRATRPTAADASLDTEVADLGAALTAAAQSLAQTLNGFGRNRDDVPGRGSSSP